MENTRKAKSNKKSSKTVIAILLMLSIVLTTGTFAYWANYVEGTSTEAVGTLEVGSGDIVETEFVLYGNDSTGGLLVPAGQAINSEKGAVEKIDLSYTISWEEDEETTQMLGVGTIGEVEIDYNVVITIDDEVLDKELFSNIYNLIIVTANKDNVSEMYLDGYPEYFVFRVTMDEPANQEEYNLISNAEISITFTYSINTDDIDSTDY